MTLDEKIAAYKLRTEKNLIVELLIKIKELLEVRP